MANTEYRDAVRILFLLVEGSIENAETATSAPYPRRFEGETRLQALDFWVRYPDYLADELLAQYLQTQDKARLDAARAIFEDDEPSEKSIPMLRRYFGAYEPLDTVLSILAVAGLVRPVTIHHPTAHPRHFLLSQAGVDIAKQIVEDHSIFAWYANRAKLVLEVAKGRGGAALKERQHQQKEYHEAHLNDLIPTIAERVLARLEEIEA
ncbi:hypothetical protein [Rhizobium leguminosarum]|uniref:hypothetical protein n=1 Tax=Rhizobium leguminosarum TaxID=384 RepID=UPI00103974C4|nr:hypothetical protein [Rhizobium leguminosarum]TBY27436.1 hypothetical protein E0H55_27490 [Rhizobium leguminosarum bv. viciae]